MFRDIALAQTIEDGGWPADPYYAGEESWYPPLVPAMVALCAKTSGMAVPLVYTKGGAILDLLGPIALFVLVTRLFGSWAGLASVVSFMFLGPDDLPPWAAPTYSPWMFPATFMQALFYLGLAALFDVTNSASHEPPNGKLSLVFVGVGAMLGLLFLGHAAPAVLFGTCILVSLLLIRPNASGVQRAASLGTLGLLVLGSALLVASPFLRTILFHYHLKILNPVPNNWVWDEVIVGRWRTLAMSFLTAANGVALVGFIALLIRKNLRWQRILLFTWMGICCGLMGYGYLQQAFTLPAFIPQYHFLFYLRATFHVLFGFGLVVLVETALSAAWKLLPMAHEESRAGAASWIVAVLVCAICAVWLLSRWPTYTGRTDFTDSRSQAWVKTQRLQRNGVVEWLRANTPRDEVVLTGLDDGLFLVGPAGRRVVATSVAFSNPYMLWAPRQEEHSALSRAFRASDEEGFRRLAKRRGIHFVVLAMRSGDVPACAPFSREVYAMGDAIICRVDDSPAGNRH